MRHLLALLAVLLVAGAAWGAPNHQQRFGKPDTVQHWVGLDASTDDSPGMEVDGLCSVRFTLGSGDSGTATLYECDAKDDPTSSCTSETSFTASTATPYTFAPGQRWVKVAASATTLDDSEMTIDCTRNQLSSSSGGGSEAMFDFCRGGGKGVGWDSDTRTYGATCGNYNWSGEVGGFDASDTDETGFHSTPTTAGGNATEIVCTGVYSPHPHCLEEGEVIFEDAMADLILAQEMTRGGGTIFLPQERGYRFTGYAVGQCGDGNSCPRLRPPYDTFMARAFATYNDRQLVMEGRDPDQFDRRREGTALLVNTGNADDAQDPADNVTLSRRQNQVGLQASILTCAGAEYPCNPTNNTGVKNPPEAFIARELTLSGPQSDPAALCLPELPLSSTGTCHDPTPAAGEELWSHRHRCSTDGDCTGLDAETSDWECEGFASAIAGHIGGDDGLFAMSATEEQGVGSGLSGVKFMLESVDTGTTCDGGNGLEAAIHGSWPFLLPTIGDTTDTEVRMRAVGQHTVNTRPGFKSVTAMPANSYRYRVTASEVPNASELSGHVVAIVDDDGSCTDVSGDLSGGGSTLSECVSDGSNWSVAACTTTNRQATGCVDGGTAFNLNYADGPFLESVVVAKFHHEEANPIIDFQAANANIARMRDSLIADNFGRITDTNIHFLDNTIIGNEAVDVQLMALGFSGSQRFNHNRVVNNKMSGTNDPMFTFGEGVDVEVCGNEFIGNDPGSWMFRLSRLSNAVFCNNVGRGNTAPIYMLYNQNLNGFDFGSLTIRNDHWKSHQALLPTTAGSHEMEAAVIFSKDGFAGSTQGMDDDYLGPYIIDGLVVETAGDGALVFVENGYWATSPNDINSGVNNLQWVPDRMSITNSRIASTDGGSVVTFVRGAQDNGSPERYADFENAFSHQSMPYLRGNIEGVSKSFDWEYPTIDSANGPTCVLSLTSATTKGEVLPGTRQAIRDANAAAATDACDNDQDGILIGADGTGDETPGTDMRVCECQDVGSNPVWTAVYP